MLQLIIIIFAILFSFGIFWYIRTIKSLRKQLNDERRKHAKTLKDFSYEVRNRNEIVKNLIDKQVPDALNLLEEIQGISNINEVKKQVSNYLTNLNK